MLGASVAVTLVAVLGGTGVLPASLAAAGGSSVARDPAADGSWVRSSLALRVTPPTAGELQAAPEAAATTTPTAPTTPAPPDPTADTTLPAGSGEGRRVVYSESRQRVWLVEEDETVHRTYLVSGSVYDNLEPGTYEVYSRSEDATGIDDSGTMKYFVRFTQGDTGAAIGFHDIPVDDGERVQTFAQLGTPQSHGCIRQRRSDAVDLWEFAPLGTTVVVTA